MVSRAKQGLHLGVAGGQQGGRVWPGVRCVAHSPGWWPGTGTAAMQRELWLRAGRLGPHPSPDSGTEGGPQLRHAEAQPAARQRACRAMALALLLVMHGPKSYA